MRRLPSLLLFALLLWPLRSRADAIAPYDVRAGIGVGALSTQSGGPGLQLRSLFRLHYFGIGAGVNFNTWLWTSALGGFVDAGFVWRAKNVRFEVLGRVGGARHFGIGSNFLSENDGVDVTLPYAGGEISLSWVRKLWKRGSFLLGAAAWAERDFYTSRVHYTYEDCGGWLGESSNCTSQSDYADVGWLRLGGGVVVGVQLDLGPKP